MKTIYKIDEQGFYLYQEPLELHPTGYDEENNPIYDIPNSYVDVPLPNVNTANGFGFWKPKWTGAEWVEARPQKEIDDEKKKPAPLTPTELILRVQDFRISGVEQRNAKLQDDQIFILEATAQSDERNAKLQDDLNFILEVLGG